MNQAIKRYRFLANLVGTLLVLLVIAMVAKYAFDHPGPVGVVAPVHGLFFAIYVAFAYDLTRRASWPLKRFLVIVAGGVVPFMTFIVERKVTRELRSRM